VSGRLGGRGAGSPIPWPQLVDLLGGMPGDASQDVSKLSLRIGVIILAVTIRL
jgi:hypothetical protein